MADSGKVVPKPQHCLDPTHLGTGPPGLPEVAGMSVKREPVDPQTLSCTTMEVPAVITLDVSCQTECSPTGKLSILLSATDGAAASTQVTHAELLDKVCHCLATELEAYDGGS